jgi:hypothetical protein
MLLLLLFWNVDENDRRRKKAISIQKMRKRTVSKDLCDISNST